MDKPRPVDFNCLTTAAREVRLSRVLPLPPPTPLCQMLSCSSRRTTAMASIPSSTFASGSTWERTEESTSIINLFAIEFVREKVRERKKSNREGWMKRNTHQSFQQLEVIVSKGEKEWGTQEEGRKRTKEWFVLLSMLWVKKRKKSMWCGNTPAKPHFRCRTQAWL
ncbi:uncharacterized protein [Pyrus communis]|uniref:uncharacterized protein isoform X1 n=1 Tax=Pyrus communis TaxID=23211 RepID=UPI0035BFEA1D